MRRRSRKVKGTRSNKIYLPRTDIVSPSLSIKTSPYRLSSKLSTGRISLLRPDTSKDMKLSKSISGGINMSASSRNRWQKIECITEDFWKQNLDSLISSTLDNMTVIEWKAFMVRKFLRTLMMCAHMLSKHLRLSDSQVSAFLQTGAHDINN